MIRELLVATCAGVALTAPMLAGRSNPVDPITEWSVAASNVAAANGVSPLRTPITFALLHLTMYDAVNAVAGDRAPYAVTPPVVRPASAPAAAIEAGYRILLAEFPNQQEMLAATYERLRSGLTADPVIDNGAAVGMHVASALLALRAHDGRTAVVPYTPLGGPGAWVPTPPAHLPATSAFLAHVTPFTMTRASQFRPAGPLRLRSRTWATEYDEVRLLGALTGSTRTPEQTATAMFWEPLAGTVWPATIRRIAGEQALDLVSSARFQAATFTAFADSLIACWDAKFHFQFWRPVTAIQHADTDLNPRTPPDPTWQPLAETPNFPEYPSGHTCATAAVADTIDAFFPYEVLIPTRNVVTGEERYYREASALVDEVVEARMLIGVHFRSANEDGAEIGRRVARNIQKRWFKEAVRKTSVPSTARGATARAHGVRERRH